MKAFSLLASFLVAIFAVAFIPFGPAHALPGGNLMNKEASPYLQSHATDGVHWRPWGEAALAEARRLKRPVLLSIGYLACHWCHVMQRESYVEGVSVELINKAFVPVLIDREERPDLDSLFQTAAGILQLPTGWPLTMFLSDEGKPFFGATYIPAKEGFGMPSFPDVLQRVSAAYSHDVDAVRQDAAQVGSTLARAMRPGPGDITLKNRSTAARSYMKEADVFSGGFGKSAKFPNTSAMMVIWREALRTDDQMLIAFVAESLRQMARGGLNDQVAGGFYRYATDPGWRVPHFEKMLDVNASMVRLLAQVWRETKDEELAQATRDTVAYLKREMRHQSGAFISSLDADSLIEGGDEHHEGAYYRWRDSDIRNLLGKASDGFFEHYAIAPLQNIPGEHDPSWGSLYRLGSTTKPELLSQLHAARKPRPKPQRDEKILADGNGYAIRALAEAGLAFHELDWVRTAREAFDASLQALSDDAGRLSQSAVGKARQIRLGPPATLAAIAAMGHAAISLFEATGDDRFLDEALRLATQLVAKHADDDAPGFFSAADDADTVPIRLKPVFDNPNPSGNGAAISVFARLYFHTGKEIWRARAGDTLKGLGSAARRPVLASAGLINAADDFLAALQVVVIGKRSDYRTTELIEALSTRATPALVLQVVEPGTTLPKLHPAHAKSQIDGNPTAYVCRGTVCSLPTTDAMELDGNLAFYRKDPKVN